MRSTLWQSWPPQHFSGYQEWASARDETGTNAPSATAVPAKRARATTVAAFGVGMVLNPLVRRPELAEKAGLTGRRRAGKITAYYIAGGRAGRILDFDRQVLLPSPDRDVALRGGPQT